VVELNLPGTVDDIDTEFLHDLRVAVRRTRSVLKEMRGVIDPEAERASRSDLRWIQEVTGPTRDLDVLLQEWPSLTAGVPSGMREYLDPLTGLLEKDRADAFRAMRRHLRSRRFADAWAGWRDTISRDGSHGRHSGRPVGRLAARRILTVHEEMITMGSAVVRDSPPEALHDLRKKGKELRYLLELFGGMWPSERVKPVVSALKGLQDALGHYQDDQIQIGEMRSLASRLVTVPGGTDSMLALGFVVEDLASRQRQARADFDGRFAEFAGERQAALVRDTFRPGGKHR
jgi:CHAD domain-containing protein